MAKQAEAWIESSQKRALEITIASPLIPAAGSVAMMDRVRPNTYEVERSLWPGSRFMTRKFGDPTRDDFLHRWLRRAMADELPQVMDVLQGSMTLIGPRADTPEHVDALFEAVRSEDPDLHDQWKEVRFSQKPGIISSYAVYSHRHNLEGVSESERFADEEAVIENARMRAELDVADFHAAGMAHDLRLVASTAAMAVANYGHYLGNALGLRSQPIETEPPLPAAEPLE